MKYHPCKWVSKQVGDLLGNELPVAETAAQYRGLNEGLDEYVLLSGQPRDRVHGLLHGPDCVLLTHNLPPHVFD